MENSKEPSQPRDDQEPITPQVLEPGAEEAAEDEGTFVSEPSKLIRIASMTRAMLEEVRASGMDDTGRQRLLDVRGGPEHDLQQGVLGPILVEQDREAVGLALIAVALKAEELSGGAINAWGLRIAVAIGVAIGISLGALRIVLGTPLHYFIGAGYVVVVVQTLQSSVDLPQLAPLQLAQPQQQLERGIRQATRAQRDEQQGEPHADPCPEELHPALALPPGQQHLWELGKLRPSQVKPQPQVIIFTGRQALIKHTDRIKQGFANHHRRRADQTQIKGGFKNHS